MTVQHHIDSGFFRWFSQPSKLGEVVLLFLLFLVVLVGLLAAPVAHADEGAVVALLAPEEPSGSLQGVPDGGPAAVPTSSTSTVESYIVRFLGRIRDIRWRRAPALAQLIESAAERHRLDPFLLAIVAKHESSFWEVRRGAKLKDAATAPLVGKKGEVGLMQVWGRAADGCDLTTSEGQLDCGAAWLRSRIDSCGGDVLCGLERYQGRACAAEAASKRWRKRGEPVPRPCGPLMRYREWMEEKGGDSATLVQK